MKRIPISSHKFEKTNLVTLKSFGDRYKCALCGCEGHRAAFSDVITVTEREFKKSSKCTYVKPDIVSRVANVNVPIDMPYIGITAGNHKVVPCPDEYKEKFSYDVWVFSEKRREPVRLLSHEYTPIS